MGQPKAVEKGTVEEFITEHYWGYARQRDGGTVEYQVEHPRWRVWPAATHELVCDVDKLYGSAFAESLRKSPDSAFLAEGSAVTVYGGSRLPVTPARDISRRSC